LAGKSFPGFRIALFRNRVCAEDFIDETTDKIYNSEPYKKAGNTMEKATLSLFRKAGKYWGKL
jgi:hypothetical protein